MSTTLGSFLRDLEPGWNIKLFERLMLPGMKVLMKQIKQERDMLHYVN